MIDGDFLDARCSREAGRKRDTLSCVMAALNDWYPQYINSLSAEERKSVTRIAALRPKMLKTQGGKTIKLKAAETRHCLPFFVELIRGRMADFGSKCDAAALLAAGESLLEWTAIVKREPRRLSTGAYRSLCDAASRFVCAADAAGVTVKPKQHMFMHLTLQSSFKGKPRFYTTYLDEGLNKVIMSICASSHRRTMERRLFAKFRMYQSLSCPKDCEWW